ncbi:MAG TPA: DUF971 domain-containing protein [Candidatus Binatia bacterium]|nr:DUF971 domain-containing protein [Candidatus Binatia bacterium]
MAASRTRPTEVRRVAEEQLVRVTWADGHVGEYTFTYLRGWCPCALCQGHGGERHFVEVDNPQLASINAVGNYALGLVWADGHDTGIYSYAYLRGLCPCAACTAARSDSVAQK